jgi:predicted DNA-binding protein (MmcQ/YjbR family)
MESMALRDYCLKKKGAVETFPFGDEVRVFKVMNKIFALLPVAGTPEISLKCEPTWAVILRNTYKAVQPGYHLNKEHWNTLSVDGSIPDGEILMMIDHSYDQVVKGLSRKDRAALETQH